MFAKVFLFKFHLLSIHIPLLSEVTQILSKKAQILSVAPTLLSKLPQIQAKRQNLTKNDPANKLRSHHFNNRDRHTSPNRIGVPVPKTHYSNKSPNANGAIVKLSSLFSINHVCPPLLIYKRAPMATCSPRR